MKVLITGTAGFIGFHLVHKFINAGYSVIGIDSINDYYDVNLKYARLAESGIDRTDIVYNKAISSSISDKYSFYNLLLEDDKALHELFAAERPDVVINLAAQAGVRYSLENPHAYIKSNVEGFVNIIECSRKFNIKHFIYASSSSVYGLNNDSIYSVRDNVDHPVSLYAATKRSNELMAHVYSHLYNLPTTGIRFFTVYGPWGRPDMAPMLFARAILDEKPISAFNHGNMQRDFTFIDDIVEGVFRLTTKIPVSKVNEFAIEPLPSNSSAPFSIYNIGNNSPVKLMDFISTLEEAIGKKADIVYKPIQPGDVTSTYADITTLIAETGYHPKTSLKSGIEKFVSWYLEFYKHPNQ